MDLANVSAIIVAVVAALGAWAAQRSISRANMVNAKATAEVEAYNRARTMDIKTIERQDLEIEEIKQQYEEMKAKWKELQRDNALLHAENQALRKTHSQQVRNLHEENRTLRDRVERLEKQLEERNNDEQGI